MCKIIIFPILWFKCNFQRLGIKRVVKLTVVRSSMPKSCTKRKTRKTKGCTLRGDTLQSVAHTDHQTRSLSTLTNYCLSGGGGHWCTPDAAASCGALGAAETLLATSTTRTACRSLLRARQLRRRGAACALGPGNPLPPPTPRRPPSHCRWSEREIMHSFILILTTLTAKCILLSLQRNRMFRVSLKLNFEETLFPWS